MSRKLTSSQRRGSIKSGPESEDEEEFQRECEAVYLTVLASTTEDITSQEELTLLLQHARRNPSKKTIAKYWNDKTDSYTFRQFCGILQQEPKTSKKELIKAFKKIDINGDGFITHDELYQILTKRGDRMTKAEVRTMIDDADFNGDGKLDYEEFCNMMDATSAECKKVHLGRQQKVKDSSSAAISSKRKESTKELAPLRKSVAKPERTSIVHEDKRSSTLQSKVQRKSSLISKSRAQFEIDDEEDEKDDVVFSKLVKEPSDLTKWKYHYMKGCFFSEDGVIESHQYSIKVLQPTVVWISLKATTPKYGKINEDILASDMTIFLVDADSQKLLSVSNSIINSKYCLQYDLDIGTYNLLTFSSGNKLENDPSSSGQLGLVKGSEDDARLTKACKESLLEIFYRCDLDGNGFLSRDEFNQFQIRTSGESVDDESWDVVKENFEMTPQEELTPDGFINLNLMEAKDPDGGEEELWVTLTSLGYSKKLLLIKACPFQVEVFAKKGKVNLSLVGVSNGGTLLEKAMNESIKAAGQMKHIKNKRDLSLYHAQFEGRTSIAVENMSHSAVGVRLNCSSSDNCISHQGDLDCTVEVDAKHMKVIHHLTPLDPYKPMRVNFQETVIK